MAGSPPVEPLWSLAFWWLRSGTDGRWPGRKRGREMMDTKRLVLLFIFGFSLLMLWDAWEKEHRPRPVPQAPQASSPTAVSTPGKPATAQGIASGSIPPAAAATVEGKTIEVRTD